MRRTLKRFLLALTVTVLGMAGWLAVTYFTMDLDTIDQVTFNRELTVPPLADSVVEHGVRTFDLTLQRGETDFGQPELTPTWGINGDYLGPTIRADRGERVRIRVHNDLSEPSTMHWHGMHLPAAMDGGPHQMIEPGKTWTPTWRIDQPAASLWYHPHPHGATAIHVYRGLSGMFIIDDKAEAALPLPRTYGVDDLPLIVQDKKFHGDGRLDTSHSLLQFAGILGDTVVVNGVPNAYFDVTTKTVRLRILDGSNTRPYDFKFDDNRVFQVIGSDGGLLDAPVDVRHVQLSPGERAEVVVKFAPNDTVRLQSGPSDTGDRLAGGLDHLEIMEFRAGARLGGLSVVPERLVSVPVIDPSTASRKRSFELSGFSINGRTMDMDRVDAVVQRGDTEIWAVTNADGRTHNFHVHDVQFQILTIAGREPPPHLRGWKDTVWLRPHEKVRLIMTFKDYASERWPYMFHCHVLLHEDKGLMGQFIVVEPGVSTRPEDHRIPSQSSHHSH